MSVLSLRSVGWRPRVTARSEAEAVLEGVDLQLAAGEWLSIIGPSGGGKTTLLSLAAGLLWPTSGDIRLLGSVLADLSEQGLADLRSGSLGMVFQNYHLDDSRAARENILLPGYFSKLPWAHLKTRCQELAQRLELSEHLDKRVSVLSGGQRQRVAVARALLLKPQLILADEPTGALDRPTAQLVLDLLSEEHQRGAALLTVTHDRVVRERSDRCLELRAGHLADPESAKSVEGDRA